MRNLTNARSVGAKASMVRSSTRKSRKMLTLGGAMLLSIAGASTAQAQCSAGPGAFGPFISTFAGGGAAAVSSLISTLNTVNTTFLTQSTAFVSAPGDPQPNQSGGGIWTRGIGGTVQTDTRSTAGDFSIGIPGFVAAIPGTVNCDTRTRQDFAGYQAGADIARLNIGGLNFHMGLTAGYVGSDSRDISPGGTFRSNFQIPFAGLYAAWTLGNFFADTQVRWDFYGARLTDPVVNANGQEINARSVSLTGNAGYRADIGNGWFVEPSLGVIYSSIDVDPMNFAGTFVFGTGPVFPAIFEIERFQSILGRASLRVGTNFVSGGVAWQPFATASVFHEFAGNINSNLRFALPDALIPGGFSFNGDMSSSRIETYGQFALGIAGQIVNTGWLGYARVDYRVGPDIEGWSINAGLRYQFTPERVAAPLITKAPKSPILAAVGPYNWNGFYIGGYVGSNFGTTDWRRTEIPFAFPDGILLPNGSGVFSGLNADYQGFIGGGQIGYNYQSGALVAGIEIDAGGSNAKGGKACPAGVDTASNYFFTCESHQPWLASFTGRLGYAYDRALFYVKGGLAAGETTIQTVFNAGTQTNIIFGGNFANPVFSDSKTRVGWTLGGGFEYGLTQNWSAKAEYMYYDLGTDGYSVNPGYLPDIFGTPPFTRQTIDVGTHGNVVKIGLNYRFTSGPALIAASY
jgi:opacity protein-like surface antigen